MPQMAMWGSARPINRIRERKAWVRTWTMASAEEQCGRLCRLTLASVTIQHPWAWAVLELSVPILR
jgi:hypothetical protein